jgi:hypothetical protein
VLFFYPNGSQMRDCLNNLKGEHQLAKRKKPEDKEKELLEKRLLKIQFYESLTSIVVAIVTMLLAVVTAILNWIK